MCVCVLFTRISQKDEELSAEAGRVIDGLPSLSFMKAKFLMFPSIIISKECSAEWFFFSTHIHAGCLVYGHVSLLFLQ